MNDKNIIDARVCEICGKNLPKGKRKYCSDECLTEADRRKSADRQKRIKEKEDFESNSNRTNVNPNAITFKNPGEFANIISKTTLETVQKMVELSLVKQPPELEAPIKEEPDLKAQVRITALEEERDNAIYHLEDSKKEIEVLTKQVETLTERIEVQSKYIDNYRIETKKREDPKDELTADIELLVELGKCPDLSMEDFAKRQDILVYDLRWSLTRAIVGITGEKPPKKPRGYYFYVSELREWAKKVNDDPTLLNKP